MRTRAADRRGVAGAGRGSDDFASHSLSLSSSKWSSSSFEDCLRAGEVKLREEIRRLHKELTEVSVSTRRSNRIVVVVGGGGSGGSGGGVVAVTRQ